MKYSAVLIHGCHFPESAVKIIETNSSLSYFNKKLKSHYNCEILEIPVLVSDEEVNVKYFLSICSNQDDKSILNKLGNFHKFGEALELFDLENITPYFIAVPIKI